MPPNLPVLRSAYLHASKPSWSANNTATSLNTHLCAARHVLAMGKQSIEHPCLMRSGHSCVVHSCIFRCNIVLVSDKLFGISIEIPNALTITEQALWCTLLQGRCRRLLLWKWECGRAALLRCVEGFHACLWTATLAKAPAFSWPLLHQHCHHR